MTPRRILTVLEREFATLYRTRTFIALAVLFVLLVVGLSGAAVGTPGGYLSLTLDLLMPVELLIPVLAFAFIYRAIQGDSERGELDVLRTYPISRVEYILGVYLGRLTGLWLVLLAGLVLAGLFPAFGSSEPVSFLATHSAGDVPLVYVRFIVVTVLYTAVVASLAVAASALAGTARSVLALSIGLVLLVSVGLDLLVVGLLSNDVVGESVWFVLGLTPASAYRGLVLETAVSPALADPGALQAASPVVSLFGLVLWTVVGIGTAVFGAWQD